MGDHTLTVIILATLVITVAILGYVLGEFHRHKHDADAYIRQLEEHERRIRANSALIHAIAEDYDPPPPGQRRRRELPEGWKMYTGGLGALLLLITGCTTWVARHARPVTAAVATAAGTAVIVAALLPQGAHPGPGRAGPPPPRYTATVTAQTPAAAPSGAAGRARQSAQPSRPAPPAAIGPERTGPDPSAATPSTGPHSGSSPPDTVPPSGAGAPSAAPTWPTCLVTLGIGTVLHLCV